MSSERDELAQIIYDTLNSQYGDFNMPDDAADAILAAGWHRPRTITTAEELDKCPPGTAVIDSIGLYALVTVGHQVTSFGVVKLWPYEELLAFPVTVLHEGASDE